MMVRTTGESVDESFVLLRGLLHYTDQEVRPSLNQPQPLGALTHLLSSPARVIHRSAWAAAACPPPTPQQEREEEAIRVVAGRWWRATSSPET